MGRTRKHNLHNDDVQGDFRKLPRGIMISCSEGKTSFEKEIRRSFVSNESIHGMNIPQSMFSILFMSSEFE